MDVRLGSDPGGFVVWLQLSVAFSVVACGVQLRPIAGALAPTVAGALIVRLAPVVTAKEAAPAGIVQAKLTKAVGAPAVATVTATVPVPPVSVALVGSALSVGAVCANAQDVARASMNNKIERFTGKSLALRLIGLFCQDKTPIQN